MSAVQEHQTITTLMSHDVNAVAVPLIPEGLMIGDTVEVNWRSAMLPGPVIGTVETIDWGTGWVRCSFWEYQLPSDSEMQEWSWCVPGDRVTKLLERSERTRKVPKSLEDYDLRGFKQC